MSRPAGSDARRSAAFTTTAAARRFRRADVTPLLGKSGSSSFDPKSIREAAPNVRRPHHDRDGAVLHQILVEMALWLLRLFLRGRGDRRRLFIARAGGKIRPGVFRP